MSDRPSPGARRGTRPAAPPMPPALPAPDAGAAPADGLRGHCATLRSHARRLRAGAAALEWRGPQADALRAEVTALADRCSTAADGFALAAAQLDGAGPRRH
ncbi:hypothetical protein AB0P15_10605 [Streptomyces sp. NPDC087917]|uniref:hypothetical protein n=1 Tax=unclassified Streptomyces TaxID=2593676 RepID=UPI00343C12F8